MSTINPFTDLRRLTALIPVVLALAASGCGSSETSSTSTTVSTATSASATPPATTPSTAAKATQPKLTAPKTGTEKATFNDTHTAAAASPPPPQPKSKSQPGKTTTAPSNGSLKYVYPREATRNFIGVCTGRGESTASCECIIRKYEAENVSEEGQSLAELLGYELALKERTHLPGGSAHQFAVACHSKIT